MNKRVSSRAIIFDHDEVYLMFRRKVCDDGSISEYYVVPVGGVQEGESLEENLRREFQEELSVNVSILKYLGMDEESNSVAYFFLCKIASGIPELGGEELDKCCEDNFYEIRKVKVSDFDSIDVLAKDIIKRVHFYF